MGGFDYPANVCFMALVHLNMIACTVCTGLWPCSGFSRSWVSYLGLPYLTLPFLLSHHLSFPTSWCSLEHSLPDRCGLGLSQKRSSSMFELLNLPSASHTRIYTQTYTHFFLFFPLSLILMNKPNVDRWHAPDVGDCREQKMIPSFSIISK